MVVGVVIRPLMRLARQLGETLALAAAAYLAVTLVIQPYQVDGASMTPNLQNGERLFVSRSVYAHFDVNRLWNLIPGEHRNGTDVVYPFHAPKRGDIVVFHPPVASDKPYVKRVIGLPGERVSFRGGYVSIDGQRLDEPYINGPITQCEGPYCHLGAIPDGYVFVLGDNRTDSSDSRVFGLVSVDRIVGEAWFANWPPGDVGLL